MNSAKDSFMLCRACARVYCSQLLFQEGYKNTFPELTNLSMEVVGAYVSWIDIMLIANDKFIQ